MSSKSILGNGFRITYIEANREAKNTIFFIHGNSGSSRTWRKQLNDPLLKDYRMVAFDLPGHGDSSASADPEKDYSLPGLGEIVSKAINQISGGNNYTVVGFSLGSNVLTEALNWIKPNGIVVCGCSAVGGNYTMDKVFLPDVDGSVLFSDGSTAEGISTFAANLSFNVAEPDKAISVEDYYKVKPGFRPTMMKTAMEGKISDEIALLKNAGVPVLIIFGKNEKFANPNYLDALPFPTWHNTIFKLPNAGHAVFADQPKEFNELLSRYCSDRFGS